MNNNDLVNLSPEQVARLTKRLGGELESWLRDRNVEPHYSAARTAELLDVSERTVWSWVELGERSQGSDGIWPTVKLSHKTVRIPSSAINRFLQAHTVAATVTMATAPGLMADSEVGA